MKNKRVNKLAKSVIAICLCSGGAGALAQDSTERPADEKAGAIGATVDMRGGVISWPETTRKAALVMIDKYGQPDEASDAELAWNDKGVWDRIVVRRDNRRAGSAMDDFIENTVWYVVPPAKLADLAEFDASLAFDKRNNLLSARSSSEEANILALNLADQIATGKRGVASAKRLRRKTEFLSMAGKSSDYSRRLMFTPGAYSQGASQGQP